jgi:23S rRNA (guanosine2251-2'-O)-methyltransferase
MQKKLFLILHDIRSAYNVGAIFRTADGSGINKIYLSGYTPYPPDKNKPHKTQADKMIEKTALGAEKSVAWKKCENLENLLEEMKKKKIRIIALEKTKNSTDIKKFKVSFPSVLILGNEVDGVPESVLRKCNAIIEIPMRGKKESLNVSVAAGIAMYNLLFR